MQSGRRETQRHLFRWSSEREEAPRRREVEGGEAVHQYGRRRGGRAHPGGGQPHLEAELCDLDPTGDGGDAPNQRGASVDRDQRRQRQVVAEPSGEQTERDCEQDLGGEVAPKQEHELFRLAQRAERLPYLRPQRPHVSHLFAPLAPHG